VAVRLPWGHVHGKLGEFVVRTLLRLSGFRIVRSRYCSPVGEIDIIARRGDLLLFVEVKSRFSRKELLGSACSPHQLARIKRAAEFFLARNSLPGVRVRFDLYLVYRLFMVRCLRGI